MNKLQKSAWINLLGVTICVSISTLCHYSLACRNVKGISYIMIFLLGGCLTGLAVFLILRKKGIEAGFDEREKAIHKRAFIWATSSLLVFLGCVCIIPFFTMGGGSDVPVFYLPVIF